MRVSWGVEILIMINTLNTDVRTSEYLLDCMGQRGGWEHAVHCVIT